jgi:tetratricopeptide (TPR) repeat protein
VAARRGDRLYRARKLLGRQRTVVAVLVAAIAVVALLQLATRWRGGGELSVFEQAVGDGETRRGLHEGAERLARFDAIGGRESFRRAVESGRGHSPDEALAWDGLARAQSALGEVGRAAEAARRAGDLSAGGAGDLPRDEAERIRVRALAAERRWELAIPALEGLFGRLRGRVDIGLDLVAALLAGGRSDEADNALSRLRQLQAEFADLGGDPRLDLIEAEVALRLSEFQRAAAAAARGGERAAALGAGALGLRAERLHAEAIGRLDRRDEARRDLESVEARALAAGLGAEAAAARLAIGFIQFRTAGNDEARQSLEQARAGLRAAGARAGEIVALVQLSLIAGKREEYAAGLRLSDEALQAAREIRDRWSEGFVLSQRLVLLNWADDEVTAMAIAEPALAALRDSGNRTTLLSTLSNLAMFRIERLELEQAAANLDEAEALARRVGSQSASGKVDRGRGYLQQTRGDLDLARQSYNAGLEKARSGGTPLEIGITLAHLAWLEVAANRPDEAARHAGEAIAAYRSAGDLRQAARLEPTLAWVDARHGDAASARRRLTALKKASADGSGPDFGLLSTEARVAEVLGDWRHAVEVRRRTIRMASEWETAGLVLEERLGLARALHGMGDRPGLEKLVAELLPEVERLGLRGAARDLRALLASPRGDVP